VKRKKFSIENRVYGGKGRQEIGKMQIRQEREGRKVRSLRWRTKLDEGVLTMWYERWMGMEPQRLDQTQVSCDRWMWRKSMRNNKACLEYRTCSGSRSLTYVVPYSNTTSLQIDQPKVMEGCVKDQS